MGSTGRVIAPPRAQPAPAPPLDIRWGYVPYAGSAKSTSSAGSPVLGSWNPKGNGMDEWQWGANAGIRPGIAYGRPTPQPQSLGRPAYPTGSPPISNGPATYNPMRSGTVQALPYGQATSQTWNQIANAAGVNRSQLDTALGNLGMTNTPIVAAWAQRVMGIPVPGDGQGQGLGHYGPAQQPVMQAVSPNTATSSYNGTLAMLQQKLGSLPGGMRLQ